MNPKRRTCPAQRGFTLIEILIALLIGLFLLGALLTVVQTNRRVFGEQNQLAQMQDNQRMALTMMGDVIQQAGYFPDPVSNTLTGTLQAAGSFAAGQSIFGTYDPALGDTIQVRYATAPNDGILNCNGQFNQTPAGTPPTTYTNSFQVLNGQLVCTLNNNPPLILVGGVPGSGLDIKKMQILYGVKANASNPGNNVDTYMNASQVGALWGNVISVKIILTFTNPMSGAGQPATIDIERVIGIMNQTGPTI